jgi:hypothetical protein
LQYYLKYGNSPQPTEDVEQSGRLGKSGAASSPIELEAVQSVTLSGECAAGDQPSNTNAGILSAESAVIEERKGRSHDNKDSQPSPPSNPVADGSGTTQRKAKQRRKAPSLSDSEREEEQSEPADKRRRLDSAEAETFEPEFEVEQIIAFRDQVFFFFFPKHLCESNSTCRGARGNGVFDGRVMKQTMILGWVQRSLGAGLVFLLNLPEG